MQLPLRKQRENSRDSLFKEVRIIKVLIARSCCFSVRLPFFLRDFGGSAERQKSLLFGGFPGYPPKKQGKEDQEIDCLSWSQASTGVERYGRIRAECGQQLGRDPLNNGSSKFLVLRSFLGGKTLGLVSACPLHTLGYACTLYIPASPPPIESRERPCGGVVVFQVKRSNGSFTQNFWPGCPPVRTCLPTDLLLFAINFTKTYRYRYQSVIFGINYGNVPIPIPPSPPASPSVKIYRSVIPGN